MSVPTTIVKPNLREAHKLAIKRSTSILAGFVVVATSIFGYMYNYKRYNKLIAADQAVNDPKKIEENYERAKKFKALRSFPGGVSGMKEYWSGAH